MAQWECRLGEAAREEGQGPKDHAHTEIQEFLFLSEFQTMHHQISWLTFHTQWICWHWLPKLQRPVRQFRQGNRRLIKKDKSQGGFLEMEVI